jgi:hypothetical protein
MGGRAQKGIDYTLGGTTGQVTIGGGQSSTTVVVHTIADHVKERNENVSMSLTNGTGYTLSRRAKAALTIVNGP